MLGDFARHRLSLAVVACAVTALVAGCGGDGPDHEQSRTLLKRLPETVEGFVPQRTFDWSDPVNLMAEGFRLPEATRPSRAVAVIRDAELTAGAGVWLSQGLPPDASQVRIGVVKLGSEDKARKLQRWLHGQDLQPPCFSDCTYSPKDLAVPGVPHVTAVQQIPGDELGPPVHYLAEFVVGPYLYFTSADGSPDDSSRFVTDLQDLYKSVRDLED